ncbi:MAG: hypothetical protein VW362_07005 [Candidatus Nanopelagicales bacterium]|jgi:hypothetical protein
MLTDVRNVSRREVMGLGAILSLAACSPSGTDGTNTSEGTESTGSVDPDLALAAQVAEQEWALVAAYDRALQAQPDLAALLTPLRDQHREHAGAVGSTQAPAAETTGAAAPASPDQVVAELLAAERAAVTERTQVCDASSGPQFASLIALIAASEAGHVEYLRRSAP